MALRIAARLLPLGLSILPLGVCAAGESVAVEPEREDVYLDRDQALREVFGGGARLEKATAALDDAAHGRLEKRLGRKCPEKGVTVYRGVGPAGEIAGYAVITDEVGKFQPITFVVGVTPENRVRTIAVMVYRESIGSEVRRRRFLSQFQGKTGKDSLRVGIDVIRVSGATLSCQAIARGAKKVLAYLDEIVFAKPATALAWVPLTATGGGRKVSDAAPLRRARYLMGTFLEVVAFGDPGTAGEAARQAFAEVDRLEDLLSTFRPESEISRVNRSASSGPVRVSPETVACVQAALDAARSSGGAFDPTLVIGGYRRVEVDEAAGTITFAAGAPGSEPLALDLGGVGKGFALDRAAEVLERHGVTQALLDFGGQVLALDPPPGASAWVVAVRDPGSAGEVVGFYEAARLSVSTSATYERGAHIVDTLRGGRATGVLSSTVCAPRAAEADALSTALAVCGAERAEAVIGGRERCAALLLLPHGGRRLVVGSPSAPVFVAARGE